MSTDPAPAESAAPDLETGAWLHTCMGPGDEEACAGCGERAAATTAEPDPDTYVGSVEIYIAAATHLTAADAPFKIHARKLAASLDRQLATKGEVQSALASTFAKVLGDLDKRRPAPPPPDPLRDGTGPNGEASIFGLPLDG